MALGAAAVGAIAGIAYARSEAASYRLRRVNVPAPSAGGSLRILHLSDLHMTPRRRRLRDWVSGLASLAPDYVVVTGDFLAHPDAIRPALEALGPLRDAPGAFVLGSNDYFAPRPINPLQYFAGPSDVDPRRQELPWPDLVAPLEESGWAHLANTDTSLVVRGMSLHVRGVDDPHIGRDDYAPVAGRAEADLTLGIAHAPYLRVINAMAADGVDVMLAGHTHGGQVRVPGVGALVTNCDLPPSRARGMSSYPRPTLRTPVGAASDRQMWLHVSAGLGTSPYAPLRFACPPEATLITVGG